MIDISMRARRIKLRAMVIIAAMLCAWSNGATAQDVSYPTKPVHLMVAGAPGGNPEFLARLLGQRLSEEFGKPFVVELVSGSNSVLAGKTFAASPPDGHTLMLGESAMMAINPALFADLPYRPLQDFAPVSLLVTVPTILVVPPSLGVSRLGDFIAPVTRHQETATRAECRSSAIVVHRHVVRSLAASDWSLGDRHPAR